MFVGASVVAFACDGVPTWQNHGPDAGPGFVRRSDDPSTYWWMTSIYCAVGTVTLFLTFLDIPSWSITHTRWLFAAAALAFAAFMLWAFLTIKPPP